MSRDNAYEVLSVDVESTEAQVRNQARYLLDLGKLWTSIRREHWKTMPAPLVALLDETFEECICYHKGCLEQVHGDWDFCKEHGEVK
jgi:hypothetical protein